MKDALSSKTRGSARLLPESACCEREWLRESARTLRARSRSPETLHALTGPAARKSACCTPRGHARGSPARPRACSPRSGQHVQVSELSVSLTPSCHRGPNRAAGAVGARRQRACRTWLRFGRRTARGAPAFNYHAVRNSSVCKEHVPISAHTTRTFGSGFSRRLRARVRRFHGTSEVAWHRARRPGVDSSLEAREPLATRATVVRIRQRL